MRKRGKRHSPEQIGTTNSISPDEWYQMIKVL